MENNCTLETSRLILNPPSENDLEDLVFHLNQTSEFSENTLNIPFPYQKEDALFWLNEIVNKGYENETSCIFAIREKGKERLIGAIGLHLDKIHQKAEVGYWLGKDFWNKGYVTEALSEILKFGFETLHLNKIFATHYPYNPSSGKVMEKCGMKQEAVLKQEYCKNGIFRDVIRYAIFSKEFQRK